MTQHDQPDEPGHRTSPSTPHPPAAAGLTPWVRALTLYRAHRAKLWALGDQGMVSLVNFLTMAAVARALGVEQFGVFFWSYVIFLLIKAMHQALIVAPMMSIGPKQEPEHRPTFYASIWVHQGALAIVSALLVPLLLTLFALVDPALDLRSLTLALIAACLGDQAQDLIRRYMFTHGRVVAAFANDVIAFAVRLALFFYIEFGLGQTITGELAYWIMAGTSGLAALVGLFWIDSLRFDRAAIARVTAHHWTFSKWLFGMGTLQFCSGHAMTMVSSLVLGPAVYGGIRATYNILAPIQVFTLALQNVAPVRAAELYKHEGSGPMLRYLSKLAVAGLVFSGIIGVLGWLFAEDIVRLLISEEFVPYAWLVNWWIVIFAVRWLQFPLEAGLRAIEYTRPLFVSVVIEAVFGLSAAYVLAKSFGVQGTMFGLVIAHIIPVTVLTVLFLRRIRRDERAAQEAT